MMSFTISDGGEDPVIEGDAAKQENGCAGSHEQNGNITVQESKDFSNASASIALHTSQTFPKLLSSTQHVRRRLQRTQSFANLLPTKTKQEVPLLFREPYVETGFRPLDQPWSYYLKTILQLHNESMNVWTHMIATILMLWKLINMGKEIDYWNDPYSWPLLAGFLCGVALYCCSSGAHCIQSKSELVHYTAFMVDYAGIGLYGLGSVIVHLDYCSKPNFYAFVNPFFVPLGALIAFAICFCCTVAKVGYHRPYPFARKLWQMTPVLSIYLLLVSPILDRLFACYVHGVDCNDSIPFHIEQIIWFVLSGAFFASDIPQRFLPGKCDVFFHSHQLFHICIMMSTLRQMDAVYIDFLTRYGSVITKRPPPTFISAFGPVIAVVISELVCIQVYRRKIMKRLASKQE